MTGSASSEYTMEIKKNPGLKLGLAGLAQFSKKINGSHNGVDMISIRVFVFSQVFFHDVIYEMFTLTYVHSDK